MRQTVKCLHALLGMRLLALIKIQQEQSLECQLTSLSSTHICKILFLHS